jgi:hypothetical protein
LLEESVTEDGAISVCSDEDELNSRNEDILVQLLDRMEAMEKHFAATPMIVSPLPHAFIAM